MAVSIYANHNKSEVETLVQRLRLNPDNNYLFCSLSGNINSYLPILFENIKTNPELDFIVVIFLYESPDFYKCINHLKQLVEQVFKKKFAVIDFGTELSNCTHFTYNIFLSEFHETWIPLSAEVQFNWNLVPAAPVGSRVRCWIFSPEKLFHKQIMSHFDFFAGFGGNDKVRCNLGIPIEWTTLPGCKVMGQIDVIAPDGKQSASSNTELIQLP